MAGCLRTRCLRTHLAIIKPWARFVEHVHSVKRPTLIVKNEIDSGSAITSPKLPNDLLPAEIYRTFEQNSFVKLIELAKTEGLQRCLSCFRQQCRPFHRH